MKVDIFNEIAWLNFRKLPNIQTLPLTEQVKKYNLYINELTHQRNVYLYWLEGHKKGPLLKIREVGYLLQEDSFDLLQEDGSNIIVTALTK